jgi:hypothetical protein
MLQRRVGVPPFAGKVGRYGTSGAPSSLFPDGSWASRTVHSRARSRSSASVEGVATSTRARSLSKEISPSQSASSRCGKSQPRSATWA